MLSHRRFADDVRPTTHGCSRQRVYTAENTSYVLRPSWRIVVQQQIISVIFLFLSDFINFRLVARLYLSRRFNTLCVFISSESRNLPVDIDLYELLSLIVIAIMHIKVFIFVTTYFCIFGPLNNCTCLYIFGIDKKLGSFVHMVNKYYKSTKRDSLFIWFKVRSVL